MQTYSPILCLIVLFILFFGSFLLFYLLIGKIQKIEKLKRFFTAIALTAIFMGYFLYVITYYVSSSSQLGITIRKLFPILATLSPHTKPKLSQIVQSKSETNPSDSSEPKNNSHPTPDPGTKEEKSFQVIDIKINNCHYKFSPDKKNYYTIIKCQLAKKNFDDAKKLIELSKEKGHEITVLFVKKNGMNLVSEIITNSNDAVMLMYGNHYSNR